MATTKTLTPTNQAITLAAFTEKPDNRTNVTNDDKLADAINTLNSKIRTISTGSLHDITTPGMYWLTSVVADKPEPGAGMYILQAYADSYRAGLYVVADNCVQYNVALLNGTWTYNKLALNSNKVNGKRISKNVPKNDSTTYLFNEFIDIYNGHAYWVTAIGSNSSWRYAGIVFVDGTRTNIQQFLGAYLSVTANSTGIIIKNEHQDYDMTVHVEITGMP